MKRIAIIFAVLIILFPSSGVSAADKDKGKFPSFGSISKDNKEPVVINGDTVEYSETGKTATATNNVVITYQDMRLTCKQAVFHTDTKEIYAEGDVLLTQEKNYFKGDRIVYNMETKAGTVMDPKVFIEPWFYGGGEKAEKSGANEYFIKRGYVTTCDKEHPHYRVQSKQLKVYLGDKVTAHDILFFIGEAPVFYFPYYSHSLKDKHPGVTIIPGQNKNWGSFVLTSWRYYFNEDFRGRFLIDYRQKRDFAYGVNLNYRIPAMGDGILRAYLAAERKNEEWTWQDRTDKEDGNNRWRIALRHKWDMDPRTLGTLEFNKMSDADVIKDYFMKDFQRDMISSTYGSIIRTDDYYTTSVLVQKRVNKFDSIVEYLPKLDFTTRSLKIGQTNFYYEGDGSFASLAKKVSVPTAGNPNYFAKRVDTENRLGYQTNILGWLSLSPFVGTQQTWYNEDIDEKSNVIRGNFFTGIGANTRFSRVFDVDSDIFNMEINKLRHIVSPTVTYNYKHRPTVRSTRLKQFDDVDSLGFVNAITPSLENKLQTKRMVDGRLQTVDITRFVVTTNYNFGFEEKKGGRLSNYDLSFEAAPYNWMRMLANSVYNPHRDRFESFSFDIVGDPYGAMGSTGLRQTVYADLEQKKWSYGGGYRWDNDLGSQLEGELMFNITPKWKLTAYQRFDLKTFVNGEKLINRFGEQEYRISRDLHCWIGELVYNISQNSGHTIWVMFRLKAFPDMPFEFEQKYNPPSYGASRPGN